MKQTWKIDPEFKQLSVPLSLEEERRLENSLIREGCKEPIAVWNGYILDGYKRYAICSYEEMEYETVELNCNSREEALLWSCKKRLSMAKPNTVAFRYLLGKRYALERKMYKKNPEQVSISYVKKIDRVGAVCCSLAEEVSINHCTVQRYGTFSLQMDKIAEKDMAIFEAILSEIISATYADIERYSTMDPTKLAGVRRKLLREKDTKKYQRRLSRKMPDRDANKEMTEQVTPLEVGIKVMPAFDPDMEFRGLMLTIPTWMNAISRSRTKTNIKMVSESTKKQLAANLRKLEEQIMQTLEVIEK